MHSHLFALASTMPLPKQMGPRFRSQNSYGNVVAPKRHLYENSNHGWSSDEPAHEPSYVPAPSYVPEPFYVPEPSYVPDPSYEPAPEQSYELVPAPTYHKPKPASNYNELEPSFSPAPAYQGGNINLDN